VPFEVAAADALAARPRAIELESAFSAEARVGVGATMSARVARRHTEVRGGVRFGSSSALLRVTFSDRMSASLPVPHIPAVIEAHRIAPRIVQTTLSGHATLKLSERGLFEFSRILAGMERPIWVSDSSLLTGYEPASIRYGRLWFEEFKSRGGRDLIVVANWSIAIMAGRAMSLGFGVRMENTPTLKHALERAQALIDAGR
jgi:hypothetical protein